MTHMDHSITAQWSQPPFLAWMIFPCSHGAANELLASLQLTNKSPESLRQPIYVLNICQFGAKAQARHPRQLCSDNGCINFQLSLQRGSRQGLRCGPKDLPTAASGVAEHLSLQPVTPSLLPNARYARP